MTFDPLAHALSPALLEALDQHIESIVDRRLAEREREENGREWLTCAQAADMLGCTPAALRERERTSRHLKASRESGRLYFRRSDIEELLDRGTR